MKIKQLSMAGLLGCAAITSAHASVTIYGIVDVPIEYITNLASAPATVNPDTGIVTNYPGGSRAGIASAGGLSGSQFGFRGVEELGSGLKALFVLENGFNPDTGTFQQAGRLFGR
ncbi:MAG: porin, partial [Comamonas sp.]